jgi:hypothetical protein
LQGKLQRAQEFVLLTREDRTGIQDKPPALDASYHWRLASAQALRKVIRGRDSKSY